MNIISMSCPFVCASRCWQLLRELVSRQRQKETSCLKSWPVTPLESGCYHIHKYCLNEMLHFVIEQRGDLEYLFKLTN